MYVCMSTCYSAPSRFLLRAHEQLRVKDLPRVPMRRLEVDSNPQPSGCKAPNIPLHHRAPQYSKALTPFAPPSKPSLKTSTLTAHYQWNEQAVREVTCCKPSSHVEAKKKSLTLHPLICFSWSAEERL